MENKLGKFLPKKNQWMIVLLIGVLLVVIAIPTGGTSNSNSNSYTDYNSLTTETESRLISILNKVKGVGEVDVMMTMKDNSKVEGIVIIADGGGNAVIVQEITSIVKALFDVDSHKIKVIERK